MKTIVVTGGAGLIGSHLCEFLLAKGNKVICIDNFLTSSKSNIAHLLPNKNFKFLKHDVTKPLKISGKISGKVHQIYNLASPASPEDYFKRPIETLMINSLGTKNALELALKHKASFLEASTSEVYGDPLQHPQKESYWGNVNSIGERSCYDESKRFAESLIMSYHRIHGLDTKIARIFNTYGPRMRPEDGRVVPNFTMQALKNRPITVYGKGKQTRSFCYVSDLVEGLYRLMNSNYHLPVNIGNDNEITILKLAKKIISLTGSTSKIIYKPLPTDDPCRRRPDISAAKKILKWNPKVKLEDGLSRTIFWYMLNC